MTYVVGINQFDANAIISDTHISWWRLNQKVSGQNVGLKSGYFFPGCIFAISGSLDDARTFVITCKTHLSGRNTLPSFWARFLEFVKSYKFPKTRESCFQLLLSSRNQGILQFYILDSVQGITIAPQGKFISIGSGKPLLDTRMQNLVSINPDIINQLVTVEKRFPPLTFPYLYCLWLTEMSQGTDLSLTEKYHVGGIFHFLWQNTEGEYTQNPAVYVLSEADPKNKIIYSWIYRVAYAQGALVVDNPISNSREIITDTAARPKFELIPTNQLQLDIVKEIDSQPFYFFCGFGFANPKHRGEFGIALTNEGKYAVDKAGNISPFMKASLQEKFSREYRFNDDKPDTSNQ